MNSAPNQTLLARDETPPVRIINPGALSSFLLIGDHAGNAVPRKLGSLGVSDADLNRHIGWDIGIGDLGALLAARIDATFIRQIYSRLVIDCNRGAGQPDVIAEVSDGTPVPGNVSLSDTGRAQRFAEIHEPYQAAIGAELARRDAAGEQTTLVHHLGDTRFAQAMLSVLRAEPDLVVGDNEPYRMDQIDYTIPRHAYPSRPYAEIEIRQDLLATPEGCARWADRLARILPLASGA
jgi:predicted N-formylglutamate amidohydrolase